ncbi:sensor histidine kinase [Kaistia algarum]|uniref:sensor histidine kinase n=1 Tax=Kaistia algarum TaxID=2083279 RepID=UPI00267CA240|nr:response regulator [Kaistia algarum]
MESSPVVLYVDDDPGLCRLAEKDLARHGYVVETATDGLTGLARIEQGGIDIVALDHHMPGKTGLELIPTIRALPEPPSIVYVTGESQSKIAVAALKAGADDYVIKELNGEFFPLLRAALASSLHARKLERGRREAEAEVRAARDRFQALAEERAVLIREMNHRVGNSLQLVASLLNMQASANPDPEVKSVLATAVGRVLAVSQVHRRLYTSDDVHTVSLDLYLGGLIEDLSRTVDGEDKSGQISFQIDPAEILTDRAVAVGVIMTELVLNALKYAYPDRDGTVRVIGRSAGRRFALTVEDDGIGPGESGKAVGTGLGRRIIQALATKLAAEIEHDVQHRGTRVTIRFDSDEPQNHA